MTWIDWSIVALYVGAAVWIGFHFSDKASKSDAEFFVAGRSLPWYIAGTSMVATTFSSDTPLFVAAASRTDGIVANWIWWASALGGLATVWFFAKLWRRSEAITEIEFIAQRYEPSKTTDGLRIFRALYDSILVNLTIMASVTLAMSKILVVLLDLPSTPFMTLPIIGGITPIIAILVILGVCAVAYTALSGLYGVVYTDLIQFALAMGGAFALAGIVYVDMSSGPGLMANLEATEGFSPDKLAFLPQSMELNLETLTFLALISFSWLAIAAGPGFYVQRMLATRSERDAFLSIYWFTFCHYVIRSWPWIMVGIASLIYFPNIFDPEQSYPEMIDRFLPIGLKGVMVASLLAAFMSTLDTHINWGASYLINDIYKPFIKKGASPEHYVKASRTAMGIIVILALIVTSMVTEILAAYKYLLVMMSGISFVLIARWYWWRINAWSEISSLIISLIVGNALFFILLDTPDTDYFAIRLAINTIATTVLCIIVTYLTSGNAPTAHARTFYRKMRIAGPGWRRVRKLEGLEEAADGNLRTAFAGWATSALFIYSLLFAVGHIIFLQWLSASIWVLVGAVSGWLSFKQLQKVIPDTEKIGST